MSTNAVNRCDVLVIGAGPAGMAAACAAAQGKTPDGREPRITLVEREERIGGILKQCIHDGFGLVRYGQRLTGPEYAFRDKKEIDLLKNIDVRVNTFVTHIKKMTDGGFELEFTNPEHGIFRLQTNSLIAATGCRERTDRQIRIHGNRPAGVFTAGQAQAFINLKGYLPGKRAVILGSGDIGLIMARRLTLEGAHVEAVYEIKSEPSGLTRNIAQCLNDYDIPLHLSATVTELHGTDRLEAVTVMQTDAAMNPIAGTSHRIACDTLIISAGLIPENDILFPLGVTLDTRTRGPQVDQYMQTAIFGLFSCGNALHVNDLVDYVSESGKIAGKRALEPHQQTTKRIALEAQGLFLYTIPAFFSIPKKPAQTDITQQEKIVLYFRSSRILKKAVFTLSAQVPTQSVINSAQSEYSPALQGEPSIHLIELLRKTYTFLKPPEMERLEFSLAIIPTAAEKIICTLEETE